MQKKGTDMEIQYLNIVNNNQKILSFFIYLINLI